MISLKVGDYVRIKNGIIDKISDIDVGKNYYHIHLYNELDCYAHTKDEIIKSSPNIIDLIEVGDYVNGYKIINRNKCTLYIEDYADEDSYLYISQQNIKSIVTKEQFESCMYKVGE